MTAAACTTAGLTVGSHSITAAYAGDANRLASTSTALSQVVAKAAATPVVVSSLNPSTFGTSVTFTVRVSTSDGSVAAGAVAVSDGTTRGFEAGTLEADGVRTMFDRIAPVYDVMNRVMTVGLDRRWRRLAVEAVVQLQKDIGVPMRLRDTTLKRELLPEVANHAMGDRALYFNPGPTPTPGEVFRRRRDTAGKMQLERRVISQHGYGGKRSPVLTFEGWREALVAVGAWERQAAASLHSAEELLR